MQVPALTSRFVSMPRAPQARMRLFCFPYAGGSAPVFAGWGERLKPEVEVWAALPPGRGMRFKETPHETVAAMVEDFVGALGPNLDRPFAFYGHSLGGLLAFEVTRRLDAEGLPSPEHLFIGASAPPHFGLLHSKIRHLPDAEFVDAIQERYAGIPAAVLNEPELMELLLPVLRADFSAYETYEYVVADSVSCPITAFAGKDDRGIKPQYVAEWDRHTRGLFEVHTVAGEHFFLTESKDFVLNTIQKTLQAIAAPAQAFQVGLNA